MATTPEGKVKRKVKAVLKKHDAYQFWPVGVGYGVSTVDCLACVHGHFLAIETKAPGKYATPRQHMTLNQVTDAKGTSMVISNQKGIDMLDNLCLLLRGDDNGVPTAATEHGANYSTDQ